MNFFIKSALLSLLIFFHLNFVYSQDLKIKFACLDQSHSSIEFHLPSFLTCDIDARQSKNILTISSDYLYNHDSCFILFSKENKQQMLIFISSEEIKPTISSSALESVIRLLENFEKKNKLINQVTIKKMLLENTNEQLVQLKYYDISSELFYCLVQFVLNNRLITIVSSSRIQEQTVAVLNYISELKIINR